MLRAVTASRSRAVTHIRHAQHQFTRNLASVDHSLLCSKLEHRGLVRASGKDSNAFLQGLITNDMECLDARCGVPCMYSMLLNTKGRVLYDLIIYHSPRIDGATEDTYLIECDREAAQDFVKNISRYKIRKKVDLSFVTEDYDVWAIYPRELEERTEPVTISHSLDTNRSLVAETYDPRLKSFARRLILPRDISAPDVMKNVEEASSELYHRRRFYFGIGEGMTDMPPGSALPLDNNAAFMNGVSFNKGCYIGQELTARTHHTGVIRKRLMPVEFERDDHACKSDGGLENNKGKSCGKLRDSRGKLGLAMLRIPDVINKGPLIMTNENGEKMTLTTKLPWWWPTETDPIIKQVLSHTG